MTVISLICLVSLILFLLFETNVLVEYGRAFKIRLPELDNYSKIIDSGGHTHYLKYLRGIYEKSFIFKLITCPICLSVWISLWISLIFFQLLLFPAIEVGGLAGYFLLKILSKYSS